ncbi:TadE/TadG family type IV pilus assembly protein [Vibrio superstes]|uniref:Pilus biosynthesis protein TadE n=1 Tax=Vibrio superstes NBRC 103154 TaxID=1219062 RepID=A0A511QQH3_9VIBR|nr:TadE/TadG family type IV pilus assembly protein [Vibrio superstes]GEM79603.1 pilus biosynthesis protein TadE [Vibrio superstes NBRC 103154]
MSFIRRKSRNDGVAILEFTIVSTVLLLLLFAIIEIGRFMFSLQVLNELTRRAARLATVCYVIDNTTLNAGSFGSTYDVPIDLDTLTLSIEYLNDNGTVISNPSSDANFGSIRYVKAEITGFTYTFSTLSSLFGTLSNLDAFQTTLPAESLGKYRPYYKNGTEVTDTTALTLNCS